MKGQLEIDEAQPPTLGREAAARAFLSLFEPNIPIY
jgi:hypothetical protein